MAEGKEGKARERGLIDSACRSKLAQSKVYAVTARVAVAARPPVNPAN